MDDADVIVVGAGLAGLAATAHLQAAGHQVLLLESSDQVGGRVRTDEQDGFLLDRGFRCCFRRTRSYHGCSTWTVSISGTSRAE